MRRICTLIAVIAIAVAPLLATNRPAVAGSSLKWLHAAGLWQSGDGSKQVLVAGVTEDQLLAKSDQLAQQGLAISAIAAVHRWGSGRVAQYVAVFEPAPDSKTVTTLLAGTWEEFAGKDMKMFTTGFRVADIAISPDPDHAGKVRYTAVWRGGLGDGAQCTDPAMPWDAFVAKAKERFDKGLRLVTMASTAVLDNSKDHSLKALFTGTWRDGQGTNALYVLSPRKGSSYWAALAKHVDGGLRSVAYSAYTVDGRIPVYVGAVRGGLGKNAESTSAARDWENFVAEHKSRVALGYRLIDISAYSEFAFFD